MAPRYNQVDGDEDGWRQDVDNLEETLGNLGLEERVRYQDIRISRYQDMPNLTAIKISKVKIS